MRSLVVVVFAAVICSSFAKEFGGYDMTTEEERRLMAHPCAKKHCDPGFECDLDSNGEAACVCIRECPVDDTIHVCSTQNVTFDSECEFFRQRCLCQSRHKECDEKRYKNAHLDYYGQCKELPKCLEAEMKEFPKRMRDWLYLVMEELDRRNDLNREAHKMIKEAKRAEKRYVLPVIWKFCDLDKTQDRYVNSEELLSITAPLKPLEHCTGPFLEGCDTDNDGIIILEEWGQCLGLDMSEIEDRCDELQNKN